MAGAGVAPGRRRLSTPQRMAARPSDQSFQSTWRWPLRRFRQAPGGGPHGPSRRGLMEPSTCKGQHRRAILGGPRRAYQARGLCSHRFLQRCRPGQRATSAEARDLRSHHLPQPRHPGRRALAAEVALRGNAASMQRRACGVQAQARHWCRGRPLRLLLSAGIIRPSPRMTCIRGLPRRAKPAVPAIDSSSRRAASSSAARRAGCHAATTAWRPRARRFGGGCQRLWMSAAGPRCSSAARCSSRGRKWSSTQCSWSGESVVLYCSRGRAHLCRAHP